VSTGRRVPPELSIVPPAGGRLGRNDGPCARPGCASKAFRVGLCHAHYLATGKGGKKVGACADPECSRLDARLTAGLCDLHYQRRKRAGGKGAAAGRARVQFSRGTARVAAATLAVEIAAAGIGGLLEMAWDADAGPEGGRGPLAWPVVERRLLAVHGVLGLVRRPLLIERAIRDMEAAVAGGPEALAAVLAEMVGAEQEAVDKASAVRSAARRGLVEAGPSVRSECGSTAGYAAHRRAGETSCQPCRDAKAARTRERRAEQSASGF